MARIKVTGYIDTEELFTNDVDASHTTGLSEEGRARVPKWYTVADLYDLHLDAVRTLAATGSAPARGAEETREHG